MKKACVLSIGDELLQGFTINTNSSWIGKKLNNYNVHLEKIITIEDELELVKYEITESLKEFDLIFVTGGLGPTLDDITLGALSSCLNKDLKFDSVYYDELKNKFKTRKMKFSDSNRSQAMVIDGAKIIPNKIGTARGIHIEKNSKHLFALPGVPIEMKMMFKNYILDKFLIEEINTSLAIIRTTGITETILYDRISDFIDKFSDRYTFSFLPSFKGVDFKIRQDEKCQLGLKSVSHSFYNWLSPYAYGWEGDTLESVLANQLLQRKITLSIAESCSGGLISKRLTDVAGSSSFFLGSIVAYSNEIKVNQLGVSKKTLEQEGAVSEAIARQMVISIQKLTNSDIAISTTGISGPSGGTKSKPVGLVYIALFYKNNITVKEFNFSSTRTKHREITSQAALDMVRKAISD